MPLGGDRPERRVDRLGVTGDEGVDQEQVRADARRRELRPPERRALGEPGDRGEDGDAQRQRGEVGREDPPGAAAEVAAEAVAEPAIGRRRDREHQREAREDDEPVDRELPVAECPGRELERARDLAEVAGDDVGHQDVDSQQAAKAIEKLEASRAPRWGPGRAAHESVPPRSRRRSLRGAGRGGGCPSSLVDGRRLIKPSRGRVEGRQHGPLPRVWQNGTGQTCDDRVVPPRAPRGPVP